LENRQIGNIGRLPHGYSMKRVYQTVLLAV